MLGLNPLTRNLLDHPETLATREAEQLPQDSEEELQNEDSQASQCSIAVTLNFESRLSNSIMGDILRKKRAMKILEVRFSRTRKQEIKPCKI